MVRQQRDWYLQDHAALKYHTRSAGPMDSTGLSNPPHFVLLDKGAEESCYGVQQQNITGVCIERDLQRTWLEAVNKAQLTILIDVLCV